MNRDFKGIWIPREIWINKDLLLIEKAMLAEIDSLDNENGCFASNDYFADFFNVSVRYCSELVSSLAKKKLIEVFIDRANGNKRTIRVSENYRGLLNHSSIGYRTTVQEGIEPQFISSIYTKGYNKEDILMSEKGENKKKFFVSGFELFWEKYPRKTAKAKALSSWLKLKPDEELRDEIIAGVLKYCMSDQWQKDDGQFIPHPATFLNQKRWEDDIKVVDNSVMSFNTK